VPEISVGFNTDVKDVTAGVGEPKLPAGAENVQLSSNTPGFPDAFVYNAALAGDVVPSTSSVMLPRLPPPVAVNVVARNVFDVLKASNAGVSDGNPAPKFE
jgi:hypothetical protein